MGLALVLEDLTWSFQPDGAPFLRIPELRIEAGTVLAVGGPSGAGKSTLLFLLAGLETPTGGHIYWGSEDVGTQRLSRRDRWRRQNLGLVFQDFQLVPELTALENVLLPLTFTSFRVSGPDRQRAADLLARLGVLRPQARASTLSRGEMQRTALARAVFSRPPVLLADEPTASLDAGNETAVADLLLEYSRDHGATVVVSTHQAPLRDRADAHITLGHGTLEGTK